MTWEWLYDSVGVAVWRVGVGLVELVVVRLQTKKPIAMELRDRAVGLALLV